MNPESDLNSIPESFHSFESDGPFRHCCDCGCELVITGQMYMVQKNYEGDECVMEYALCNRCKENLDQQISDQSKEALYDFLFDNAELVEPPEDYTMEDALGQIEECLTCGKARSQCRSYSYSGLFIGSTLIPGPMPMMLCGSCQEQVADGLSDHTKDVRDKFYEENFPGPPSEVDLPTRGKPILL